jgi:protein tyrosine phosphatase (PTP) superfamily phosphohydrolase (DUF442 family)
MSDTIENISNFLRLSERLATAGQPTSEQYPAIAAAGYGVVINLAVADAPNALINEAEIAQHLALDYIHIPVEWLTPTLADFQEFVSVMDAHTSQSIFVHCAANKRVSVFVYLYRQLDRGVAESIARQDLAKIWTPNRIWQDFIDAISIAYSLRSGG